MFKRDIEEWLRIFAEVEAGYPEAIEPYTVRAARMAEFAKEMFEDILNIPEEEQGETEYALRKGDK